MAIQKRLIDQATGAHLEELNRLKLRMLGSLDAEWKVLEEAYKSAGKSRDDKVKAIGKDRKSRRDAAYSNYRRALGTAEGASSSAYDDEAHVIDEDCRRQRDEALDAYSNTCQAAEDHYRKRVGEILEKYKEATVDAIDKFIEAHP
jgi:hypothetical protein